MSYIVLARKYRPQSFKDLVGQLPVSQTLQNALESNRIAHAYIFSGPRGVGKTTTARVLAKCLNCKKGPTIHPCHQCDSCTSISQGTSMDDVLEIDGASNRGIEQIRELRENAKYTPSQSRYRIYIIDEAHQITKDAFGALLKTLEEPPSHVIFMMATTEVHKIPAPILSRCQRFSLRPISPDLVFNHLKEICKKEEIKVEEDALKNIVRFVEGSLRDALSLLDQAVVFSPENVTSESLRDLLGLLPVEVVFNFSLVLKEGEPANILQSITQSVQNGIDLTQLGKDLQHHYHTLLLSKAGVKDPLLTDNEAILKEAKSYDYATLERNIRLLSRMLEEMRRSETPRAVFEIYALKIGQKLLDPHLLVERLEEIKKEQTALPPDTKPLMPAPSRTKQPQPSVVRQNPPPQAQRTSPPKNTKPKNDVQAFSGSQTAVMEKPVPKNAIQKIDPQVKDKILAGWPALIDEIANQKQSLGAALEEASLSFTESTILLNFEKTFSQQMVERSFDVLNPVFLNKFDVLPPIQTALQTSSAPDKATEKETGAKKITPPALPVKNQPPPQAHYEEISGENIEPHVQKALKHFPGILKREIRNQ